MISQELHNDIHSGFLLWLLDDEKTEIILLVFIKQFFKIQNCGGGQFLGGIKGTQTSNSILHLINELHKSFICVWSLEVPPLLEDVADGCLCVSMSRVPMSDPLKKSCHPMTVGGG